MNNLKTIVVAVSAAAVTGVAIKQSVETHRIERRKREEIQKNLDLDLAAIAKAGEVVKTRLAKGSYRFGLAHVMADFDNELKFQKIAIRYED